VPASWSEADERRVVAEVGALLPPLVQLELDGRFAAMLSHEPKNYALLGYDGTLLLRGVAFRSSRSEPFGDRFLRHVLTRLMVGDVMGVRDAYLDTILALRRRTVPTYDVSSRVRLTKSPEEYAETREKRRELPYEALLANGRMTWSVGDRIRVYRRQNGEGGLVEATDDEAPAPDRRDYDVDYYVRLLRETYAERLARAFTPEDFSLVFADPDQLSLFSPSVESIRPVLVQLPGGLAEPAPVTAGL
jgi:DNA polymerase elongation subunit (family B)